MRLASYEKGLVLAVLAPLLYSIRSAIVKGAPQTEITIVVFFHLFFGLIFLLPFAIKHWKKLRTHHLFLYFFRGISVAVAVYCTVNGVKHLALVDVALLESTFSLFLPLIFWIWHRKSLSVYSWILLLLGFLSVFLLLKPQLDIFHFAVLFPLGSAFASAIAWVLVSNISKTEHPITILFYFYLCGGIIAFISLCYSWKGTESIPSNWWPFLLMAFLGALYQYVMTKAFDFLAPHIVGSLMYFNVLVNALLGWFIWKEGMTLLQLFGGCLLISVGILTKRQTKQLAQQKQLL